MKFTTKSVAAIVVVVLLLALPVVISAATPPQPTYASATVDGNPGEWNLANDFFANMYRAAKIDKPIESKLYLRYACPVTPGTPGILYALVLTEPGVIINETGDQFIRFGINGTQLVNSTSGDDGAAPDFAYITSAGNKIGWEASALVDESTYSDLNIHAQVLDGGSQTSAVIGRAIDLTLQCDPTAISLSGLSATNAGSSFPALPVLFVGLTTLAAVVMVRRPLK
jgi:hypothetical protein